MGHAAVARTTIAMTACYFESCHVSVSCRVTQRKRSVGRSVGVRWSGQGVGVVDVCRR